MERLPDWEERLNALVEEWQEKPFADASADCVQFGLANVEALTGERLSAPRYSSRLAGERIIRKAGSLEALVGERLPELDGPAFARRGDIVLTDEGNLAVVFGKFALAVGERPDGQAGLVRVPLHLWQKGWRVG